MTVTNRTDWGTMRPMKHLLTTFALFSAVSCGDGDDPGGTTTGTDTDTAASSSTTTGTSQTTSRDDGRESHGNGGDTLGGVNTCATCASGSSSTGPGDVSGGPTPCDDECVMHCWYACGCDDHTNWECFGKCVKHCDHDD